MRSAATLMDLSVPLFRKHSQELADFLPSVRIVSLPTGILHQLPPDGTLATVRWLYAEIGRPSGR